MKPDALLQELERVAGELSVKVSYEALAASIGLGGLCRVKGAYRIIIDKRATVQERITILAAALVQFDRAGTALAAVEMSDAARHTLRQAAPPEFAMRRAS
jgi:hypothetical protein